MRRLATPLVWLAVLGPAVWLAYLAATGSLGANPIESLQHRTGHYALRLLAASLVISPLRRITGWGWLVAHRRTLGLAAFGYSVAHLMVYVGLDLFFDFSQFFADVVKRPYITVGMLTVVLLTPLAVTSTKGAIRRLGGRRWNRLHQLVYVAAITGTIHYLWAVKKDVTLPILYFSLFALLLSVRLYWRFGAKRAPVAGTPMVDEGTTA